MKTLTTLLITTTIASLLWGCNTNQTAEQTTPASSPSPTVKATKIDVTEKDMKIIPSAASAPSGLVDFVTKNDGPSPHELLIVKTDLPSNKLPLKDGELDEKGKGIEVIDEIHEEDLKVGTSKTLRANLSPGKYLLACNVKGHFKAGMFTPFTVN